MKTSAWALALLAVLVAVLALAAEPSSSAPVPPVRAESTPVLAAEVSHLDAVARDQAGRAAFVAGARYAVALEDARWEATHDCEQPGNWYADGWTRDGHFVGGLGVSVGAWADAYARVPGAPPSANQADRYTQERVADVVLARYGSGAWGCPTP